jgi:hypothetical protein
MHCISLNHAQKQKGASHMSIVFVCLLSLIRKDKSFPEAYQHSSNTLHSLVKEQEPLALSFLTWEEGGLEHSQMAVLATGSYLLILDLHLQLGNRETICFFYWEVEGHE